MRGVYAKRAVLILALLVLAIEGYYVYRFYNAFHGPVDPGTGVSETKAEATTEPEKTTPGGPTIASVEEEAAAEQQEAGSQQGEAEYVDAVGDIQTKAVETLLSSHNELLAYDTLTADDVERMKANDTALQGMADRAANLAPPPKYEEQHDVFNIAIDELREAARLAYSMGADPVAAAELGFDEYDGQVNEASALLQRSNDLLGKDYAAIEDIREISPEF